jgi:hypothetical protein
MLDGSEYNQNSIGILVLGISGNTAARVYHALVRGCLTRGFSYWRGLPFSTEAQGIPYRLSARAYPQRPPELPQSGPSPFSRFRAGRRGSRKWPSGNGVLSLQIKVRIHVADAASGRLSGRAKDAWGNGGKLSAFQSRILRSELAHYVPCGSGRERRSVAAVVGPSLFPALLDRRANAENL